MTPVLFPFTDWADDQFDRLATLFDCIAVYQATALPSSPHLANLAGAGRVELRVPVPGAADRLEARMAEYRSFAGMHGRDALAHLKAAGEGIPFWGERSVSRARHQIRQTMTPPAAEDDHLLEARMLLRLAEEYDRQQGEIAEQMGRFARLEARMIDGLGDGSEAAVEEEAGAPANSSGTTTLDRLMQVRIRAWLQLAARDERFPGILLTGSLPAAAALTDMARHASLLADIEMGGDATAVRERLHRLLEAPEASDTRREPHREKDGARQVHVWRLQLEGFPAIGSPAAAGLNADGIDPNDMKIFLICFG